MHLGTGRLLAVHVLMDSAGPSLQRCSPISPLYRGGKGGMRKSSSLPPPPCQRVGARFESFQSPPLPAPPAVFDLTFLPFVRAEPGPGSKCHPLGSKLCWGGVWAGGGPQAAARGFPPLWRSISVTALSLRLGPLALCLGKAWGSALPWANSGAPSSSPAVSPSPWPSLPTPPCLATLPHPWPQLDPPGMEASLMGAPRPGWRDTVPQSCEPLCSWPPQLGLLSRTIKVIFNSVF